MKGTTSLFQLLPKVLEAAGPTPVIAAGGIADGTQIATNLLAGASGVWMGTRFLCTLEANADLDYKQAITAASANDTELTTLFDGGWPNAQHRVIHNSTFVAWETSGKPGPGARPGEGEIVAYMPDGSELRRYDDVIPVRGITGKKEALALYAGTSVQRIRDIPSVE